MADRAHRDTGQRRADGRHHGMLDLEHDKEAHPDDREARPQEFQVTLKLLGAVDGFETRPKAQPTEATPQLLGRR